MSHYTKALTSLRAFVARNRFALAIACICAALFIYRYQSELDPVPRSAIEVKDIVANAIGMLQIQVRGRQEPATIAQRDAGFAVEYTTSQSSPLFGPVRTLFSSELAITDAEIRWIRGHGPRYRIGIARQEIVIIESETQPLIRYERYSLLSAAKRDRWRTIGALVFALGVALYAAGRCFHVKAAA